MSLKFEKALRLALEHHQGEVDKNGESILRHVLAVAMSMEDGDGQIVGLLHDVVENVMEQGQDPTPLINMMCGEFGSHIAAAVLDMSRRPSEPYLSCYIPRVASNPVSTRVKLADLSDNLNPERLSHLDSSTRKFLESRYNAAFLILRESGHV